MSHAVIYGGQSSNQVTRGGPDGTGRPPHEWTSLLQGTTYGANGYKSHIHAMERPVPILPASPRPATSKSHSGFEYRIRALVYLRNRCAHHHRLWHHSVLDAGPTPNNVRRKAKRNAGQFEPRSVVDIIASLDDIGQRSRVSEPLLPKLLEQHARDSAFWDGLVRPQSPRDNQLV